MVYPLVRNLLGEEMEIYVKFDTEKQKLGEKNPHKYFLKAKESDFERY